MQDKRSFTIESVTKPDGSAKRYKGGRFLGHTPDQVVRKMFTQARSQSDTSLIIVFRETTQNSLHKTFKKKVFKVKNPQEVLIDGNLVEFEYSTRVKSYK